jgi:putative transposase
MPWCQTDAVRERMRFVALHQERMYSMAMLCERFGVSRQTGSATIARYNAQGIDGLKDGSHAPLNCPHRISEEMRTLLLSARSAHPTWGPKKIRAWLAPRHPDVLLPAASTVGDLYSREGVVQPRQRQRKWSQPGRAKVAVEAPNDLWTIDFKGEFRTRDGQLCYPLTIADAHTRFLLAIDGLNSTGHAGARAVMERVFREYGMPAAIRSDNGPPFVTKAIAGLSRLNVWWMQLGIRHDRIAPRRPDQNGSHERMHRTLKAETVWPPSDDAGMQQERFDAFRGEFDFERPHEALGMKTPGSLYLRSPREVPHRLLDPEYPGHCVVRPVRANGMLYFKDREIFLSELLIGHRIALEEIADGVWSVYFYDLLLARLDERTGKLSDKPKGLDKKQSLTSSPDGLGGSRKCQASSRSVL